ncbi:MAG: zinc-ribbon domain-containing protein [Clostridia bacterium]|nr:zinc-ribbon domain-containing protein [Clostridia bacterium]
MKFCEKCGNQLPDEAAFCPACGMSFASAPAGNNASGPNYYVQGSYTPRPRNTPGLVGFILGIVSIVLAWIPLLGLGAAITGLIFSLKGYKLGKPTANTAYSVIGLILSIIGGVIGVLYTIGLIIAVVAFVITEVMYW